jgi:Uma2 family endonuclease
VVTQASDSAAPPDYEPPRRVSFDDFLRILERSDKRYEYWHGWMYPRGYPPGSHWSMSGGTAAHAELIVELLTRLRLHLRGGPCRVYPSDRALYIDADRYYFPDAFVVCSEDAGADTRGEHDAVLVIEVRSESTSGFDKGDKFEDYQQLPTLREYLLVENRRQQVTLLRRGEDQVWRYLLLTEGATLHLESIDLHVPLADLYAGIVLDPDPRRG